MMIRWVVGNAMDISGTGSKGRRSPKTVVDDINKHRVN